MLSVTDEEVMKHLTCLDVTDVDGGFRITLTFAPNDVINDTELWKEFRCAPRVFYYRFVSLRSPLAR